MLDQAAVLERRRQILRVVLLVIIFGTLPFYCLGFFLLATAPDRSPREDGLPTATFTLIGGNVIVTPTQFPTLSLTLGTIPTLLPTPFQFNPPIINPPTATWFLSATPIIFIPSSTFAPTLTFPPSSTPIPPASNTPLPPPSNTPVPAPSNTPVPSDTPPPAATNTDVPPPTNTELPPDVLPPPTDTPSP